MPTNIYGPRELVWVKPFTGATVKYGFLTNVDEAVNVILGHTAVTAAYPVGLVIGANAPKPPRAKKRFTTGVESSYCDAAAAALARADGWKISAGKIRLGSSGAKSKTVYVVHETNKIAWKMPSYLYTKLTAADLTGLGIKTAVAADKDLIFGVRYPQLPRVTKFDAAADSSYSTFCDPAKLESLPTGWVTAKASLDAF
jgi:hypothetical protein